MKTATISGRYTVGVVLYFTDETLSEQVSRATRKAMTAEQIAALTTVKVVSVASASERRRAVVDASEGSVGLGETSTVEFCEAPAVVAPKPQPATFTDPEGITYEKK